MANQAASTAAQRTVVATVRTNKAETVVIHDVLPGLTAGEVRMRVDKVGLSANNMFYAQMGEAPFLKFFSVYPLPHHKELACVPAWGTATIVESANPDFNKGEQYRGFLHMANLVQMKVRRSPEGFIAYGGGRERLNKAYNAFVRIGSAASPFHGTGSKPDLAMVAAPGVLSGFLLSELLRLNAFYGGDSVVLTSASSKLSLATAFLLQDERARGTVKRVIGFSSPKNIDFVRSTGLFDEVLSHEQELTLHQGLKPVLIDVAGDAAIYRRMKKRLAKAFAVGGTHSSAKSVTFAALGPSALLKLISNMVAPPSVGRWLDRSIDPPLEMFFAPTILGLLGTRWGRVKLEQKCDEALAAFVDAAVDQHWMAVVRSEDLDAIRSQYLRIVRGTVPPSEAVVLSLANTLQSAAQQDQLAAQA